MGIFERQLPEAAHSKTCLEEDCILTVAEIKERMNEFFQRKREEKRINRKRMRGSMHISCSKDFQGPI